MSIVAPVVPGELIEGPGTKTTLLAEKKTSGVVSGLRHLLVFFSTFLPFSLAEEKLENVSAEEHEGALKAVVSISKKIAFPLKLVAYGVLLAIGTEAGLKYSKTTIINRSTGKSTCCERTCSDENSDDLITTTFKSGTTLRAIPSYIKSTLVFGITIGDCGNGDQTLWNGTKLTFNRTEYPNLSFLVEATNYGTTTWIDEGYWRGEYTARTCDNEDTFKAKYGPVIDDGDDDDDDEDRRLEDAGGPEIIQGTGTDYEADGREEQCIYGFEAEFNPDLVSDYANYKKVQHFRVVSAYGIFHHADLEDIFVTNCAAYEAVPRESVLYMKKALEDAIFISDTALRVSAMAIDAYLTSSRFRTVSSLPSFANAYNNMISAFKVVLTNQLDSSLSRVSVVFRQVQSARQLEDYAVNLILTASEQWYQSLTADIAFEDMDCEELCLDLDPLDCAYYSEPTIRQVLFYALAIMGSFGWVYGFWAKALPHKIVAHLYRINTIFKTTDGKLHGGKKMF